MTITLLPPGVGMGGGDSASPWVFERVNFLVGDFWREDLYYREVPVTGYTVGLMDSTGSAVTSGTTTVYITKDGGTQATITGSATHEGNGQWSFDLTKEEMNADVISLTIANTLAISIHRVINTKG